MANSGKLTYRVLVARKQEGAQCGLLAEISGGTEYELITRTPAVDYKEMMAKPALVDAAINSRTTAHEREAMPIKQNELV